MRKLGTKNILSVYGDFRPVERRINNQKVSGWDLSEKSGESVEFENTYNDHIGGSISGKSELKADWQGASELSSQVQTVQGKNLIDCRKIYSPSPSHFTVEYLNSGSVNVTTLSGGNGVYARAVIKMPLVSGVTYYFKCFATASNDTGESRIDLYNTPQGSLLIKSTALIKTTLRQQVTFTYTANADYPNASIWLYANWGTHAPYVNCLYDSIMFSTSDVAYEPFIPNSPSPDYPSPVSPYITAGTYKLPCPWGGYWEITLPIDMHGIGDYKDQLEVDLWAGKGRVKQNVIKRSFDGSEAWWHGEKYGDSYAYALSFITPEGYAQYPYWYCTHLKQLTSYQNPTEGCSVYKPADFRCILKLRPERNGVLETDTVAQRITKFKLLLSAQFTAGTPYTIYYIGSTPLITNLTLTHVDSSTAPSLPLSSLNITTQTPDYPSTIVSAGGEITSRGKNLWNTDSAYPDKSITWAYGTIFSEVNSVTSDYIPVVPNMHYYCNFLAQIAFYDVNKAYLGNSEDLQFTGGRYYNSFKVPDNPLIKYLRLGIRTAYNGGLIMHVQKIQLTFGSTATPYVPYRQPSSILLPTSGSAGDEEDTLEYVGNNTWKYTQRTLEYVFDGTENLGSTGLQVNGYFTTAFKLFDDSQLNAMNEMISSHFVWGGSAGLSQNYTCIMQGGTHNAYLYIRVPTSIATDNASLNSFFTTQYAVETPFTVRYQRATPIATYLNLGELKSFPRFTHIEQLGDVKAMLNLNAKVYA